MATQTRTDAPYGQNDTFGGLLGGAPTYAGIPVGPLSPLKISAFWQGVEILSQEVAKIQIELSDEQADGAWWKPRKGDSRYKMVANQPNNYQTASEFWGQMTAIAAVYRNAHAYILRAESGRPIGLMPLEPWTVQTVNDRSNDMGNIYYQVTIGTTAVQIMPENMIHIKGATLDGVDGLRLEHFLQDATSLALARRRFASLFFANGGRIGGLLKNLARAAPKEFNQVKSDFNNAYSVGDAAFRTIVLDGKKWEFQGSQSHTFTDTQMLEGSNEDVREVARMLNLPPHLLGDMTAASYNSLEQQQASFFATSLSNWTSRIANQCWLKLLTPAERSAGKMRFIHNYQSLDYADSTATAETAAKLVQAGIMEPNEARALFNLPPADGGDSLQIPPGSRVTGESNATQPTNGSPRIPLTN